MNLHDLLVTVLIYESIQRYFSNHSEGEPFILGLMRQDGSATFRHIKATNLFILVFVCLRKCLTV